MHGTIKLLNNNCFINISILWYFFLIGPFPLRQISYKIMNFTNKFLSISTDLHCNVSFNSDFNLCKIPHHHYAPTRVAIKPPVLHILSNKKDLNTLHKVFLKIKS